MDGSKYSLEDVDTDAKKLGLSRSGFFQYLYKKYKEKRNYYDFVIYILLIVIILLLIMGLI